MATFKKGDVVELVSVVPSGPVLSLRMDEEGEVSYLIGWTDLEGQEQQRWFTEGQLALA